MPRSKIIGGAAAVALLVVLALVLTDRGGSLGGTVAGPGTASTTTAGSRDPESGLAFVDLATLPVQARRTVELIDAGGPFPYAKDGAPFGNRERVLPGRPSGFYREYTVPTPGEGDRGARRIVTGDHDRQLFYTGDHYASFARVRR